MIQNHNMSISRLMIQAPHLSKSRKNYAQNVDTTLNFLIKMWPNLELVTYNASKLT